MSRRQPRRMFLFCGLAANGQLATGGIHFDASTARHLDALGVCFVGDVDRVNAMAQRLRAEPREAIEELFGRLDDLGEPLPQVVDPNAEGGQVTPQEYRDRRDGRR